MKKAIIISSVLCVLSLLGCSKQENDTITSDGNTTITTEYEVDTELEVEPDEPNNTVTTEATSEEITTESVQNNERDEYLVQSDAPAVTVPDEANYFMYNYMSGTEFYGHELYEFDDTLTRGSVSMYNLSSYSPTTLDYEAYYGITAYAEKNNLYVKAYNHSKQHDILNSNIISDMGDIEEIDINYDDYTVIDCTELDYGLYNIVVEFDTNTVDLYFFVAENGVYTCRNTIHVNYTLNTISKRRTLINDLFEKYDITPDECLSVDEIAYPCIESEGHRCDTQRWAQLSHDLLLEGSDWSDEFKLFVYVEWFNDNIKYDDWRLHNGSSRALDWDVWDGRYSMWDLKVGVCCDFTNALIIMLREQGIPATSFENGRHMWLAVYLDGEWREVDVTNIMPYHSRLEDASDCINRSKSFNDYGTVKDDEILYIGRDVWTYDRIINGPKY